MADLLNIFNDVEYLEPRCPKCNIVLKYCINTKFDEKLKAHKCSSCGTLLK